MPFGLCTAPSSFQVTMNETFKSYLCKFVIVFFNDILIYSKTLEDHLPHLDQTFQVLEEGKFFLKMSKCSFAQQKKWILRTPSIGARSETIQWEGSTNPTVTSSMIFQGSERFLGTHRFLLLVYQRVCVNHNTLNSVANETSSRMAFGHRTLSNNWRMSRVQHWFYVYMISFCLSYWRLMHLEWAWELFYLSKDIQLLSSANHYVPSSVMR